MSNSSSSTDPFPLHAGSTIHLICSCCSGMCATHDTHSTWSRTHTACSADHGLARAGMQHGLPNWLRWAPCAVQSSCSMVPRLAGRGHHKQCMVLAQARLCHMQYSFWDPWQPWHSPSGSGTVLHAAPTPARLEPMMHVVPVGAMGNTGPRPTGAGTVCGVHPWLARGVSEIPEWLDQVLHTVHILYPL